MWDSTSRIRTKIWGKKWKMQWWKARLLRWNLEPICSHQVTKQRNQRNCTFWCVHCYENMLVGRGNATYLHITEVPLSCQKLASIFVTWRITGPEAGWLEVSRNLHAPEFNKMLNVGMYKFWRSFRLFFGSYVLILSLSFYICNTCSTLLRNLANRFKLGFPQNLRAVL